MNEPTATDIARADYADIQRRTILDTLPIVATALEWLGGDVAIRVVGELVDDEATSTITLPHVPGAGVTAADFDVIDGRLVFNRPFTVPADAPAVNVRSFMLVGARRVIRMRLAEPVAVGGGEERTWRAGDLTF